MVIVKVFKLSPEHPFKFKGTSLLKDASLSHVIPDNYIKVYECKRQDGYSLEDIYEEFNTRLPAEYCGSTLTVSDVVAINGTYYFCDTVSWRRISSFDAVLIRSAM